MTMRSPVPSLSLLTVVVWNTVAWIIGGLMMGFLSLFTSLNMLPLYQLLVTQIPVGLVWLGTLLWLLRQMGARPHSLPLLGIWLSGLLLTASLLPDPADSFGIGLLLTFGPLLWLSGPFSLALALSLRLRHRVEWLALLLMTLAWMISGLCFMFLLARPGGEPALWLYVLYPGGGGLMGLLGGSATFWAVQPALHRPRYVIDHSQPVPLEGLLTGTPERVPYQVIQDTGKPKRKGKTKPKPFYLPANWRIYAGAAALAAVIGGAVVWFTPVREVEVRVPAFITPDATHSRADAPSIDGQPTPVATWLHWNRADSLMTNSLVGDIPPDYQVFIQTSGFDYGVGQWWHEVTDFSGTLRGRAWEWQLTSLNERFPVANPTSTFVPQFNAGEIRINGGRYIISRMIYEADGWSYDLVNQAQNYYELFTAADLPDGTLEQMYLDGQNPPTSPYLNLVGTGRFDLMTVLPIQNLPVHTPLKLDAIWFYATGVNYIVSTEDGTPLSVEARQFEYNPQSATWTPSPGP
jgi:hypothetical protein